MNTTPADIERALWDLIDLCAACPQETKQTSPRRWRTLAIYATKPKPVFDDPPSFQQPRFGPTDMVRFARLPKRDSDLPTQFGLAPLLGHAVMVTHVERDIHEVRYCVCVIPNGPQFWATEDMLEPSR